MVIKTIKGCLFFLYWKIRYGRGVQVSLPIGVEKIHLEKDFGAHIQLGKKLQNRGALYLLAKGQGKLKIGEHCFFNINSSITCMERVTIGDYCKFGNNLVIVDHDHNFRHAEKEFISREIVIGNRVWTGADCVILKGVHIGDDAVIAAGSVVRKDIPAGSVFYGNEKYAAIDANSV